MLGRRILVTAMSVPASTALPSPEEVHRLVSAAVRQRRPRAAIYAGARRLLCPHALGYDKPGEYGVFCDQYGGESNCGLRPKGGVGSWRCIALEKLRSVEVLDDPWQTESHARQRCVENIEVDAEDHPDLDPQNGQ